MGVTFMGQPSAPIRQAVIQAGMVFAFEPNACWESHRVNIGGTVVVPADGCEELNRIPCHVTHV
jgi:Xaa-Pro aminopeptidase